MKQTKMTTTEQLLLALVALAAAVAVMFGIRHSMAIKNLEIAETRLSEARLLYANEQNSVNKAQVIAQNDFDPLKIKLGDKIVGMTLVSLGPIINIDKPLSADDVDAKFSGSVTLSGNYVFDMNDFAGSEMACLYLTDPIELAKLPRVMGAPDQNSVLCFSNIDRVKEVFGPKYSSGRATVMIDDYQVLYAPAEVVNSATLIRLVAKQAE